MTSTRQAPAENAASTSMATPQVSAREPFQATDVTRVLQDYVVGLKDDHRVRVGLTTHAPKVEGFVITIEVDNDILLREMMELQPRLLSFLMKHLHNGGIVLNFKLYMQQVNDSDAKRLYTAKDKFDYFLEMNPAVGELKKLFGLELE